MIIEKIKTKYLLVLLLLILSALYSNHFYNPFQYDDYHVIVDNPHIRSLKNTWSFFTDVTTTSTLPANQMYRPFLLATFTLDYALNNGVATTFSFHLQTFFWFLILVIFLYPTLTYLYKKQGLSTSQAPYLSLITCAVFSLHTSLAETINYVSARSDLLATTLCVLSFYFYQHQKNRSFIYLLIFLLACFTKQTAIIFCAILFVYSFLFEVSARNFKSRFVNALKNTWQAFAVSVAFFALNHFMTPTTFFTGASPFHYRITQPYALLEYFRTFIVPTGLTIEYGLENFATVTDIRFWMGVIFFLSAIVAIFYSAFKEQLKPIAFGLAWFLITHIPTSIFPLSETMNGHRMFFGNLGLSLALVWLFYLIWQSASAKKLKFLKPAIIIIFCFYLVGHSYGIRLRNNVWASSESVWYDASLKAPENGRVLMNYGLSQLNKNPQLALEIFLRAKKYTPYYHYLFINIAVAHERLKQTSEAESSYRQAVQYGKDYLSNYYLGAFLQRIGKNQESLAILQKSIELSPAYLKSYHALTSAYQALNQKVQAQEWIDRGLKLAPDDQNLLRLNFLNKSLEQQIQLLEASINSNPSFDSLTSLALSYYKLFNYQQALLNCQKAENLNPKHAQNLFNCGVYAMGVENWDLSLNYFERSLASGHLPAKNNISLVTKQKDQVKAPTVTNLIELAQFFSSIGDFKKAVEITERATVIDSKNALLFNNICAYSIDAKLLEQALTNCEKALKLNPNLELAKNNLQLAQDSLRALK